MCRLIRDEQDSEKFNLLVVQLNTLLEGKTEKVCAFCKKPIERKQRPSVRTSDGNEMHVECYLKHEEGAPGSR